MKTKTMRLSFPIVASLILLVLLTGCSYYKVITSDKITPQQFKSFQNDNKYFILHVADTAWHLANVLIDDSSFYGTISSLPAVHLKYKTEKGKYRYVAGITTLDTTYKDEKAILHEVHLYVIGDVRKSGNIITGNISSIRQVDVYLKNNGKTAWSFILPTVVIPGAILTIVVIIFLSSFSGVPSVGI